MSYKLSDQASNDIEDIVAEGAVSFGRRQAIKYEDSFYRIFELLGEMPRLGRRRAIGDLDEYRFLHGSHVIYYRIDSDHIEIQSILHAVGIRDLWSTE